MTELLPPQPRNHDKKECGVCESIRVEEGGFLVCSHCDIGCKKTSNTSSCGICQAGMKGLPERGTKWPDGKTI